MRLEVRKREVGDVATLEKLVVEHVDGIEPGLAMIDSRLLLGHATIDLVAQDAAGALVLIAVGVRGDEAMLLRVVDAYSWCLEYPESVQRHYPTLAISESRPPRVVFVMCRVPESFQRKVKQLSFPSVDAVQMHYIDVNGVPAVYFETLARIRRAPHGAVESIARPEPVRLAEPIAAADPTRLANDLAARIAANAAAPAPVQAGGLEPAVRIASSVRPDVVVSTTQLPTAGDPARAAVTVPVIAGASDVGAEHERVSLTSAMCHVIDASARVVGDEQNDMAVAVAELEDEPANEPIVAAVMVELTEPVAPDVAPAEAVVEPAAEAVPEPAPGGAEAEPARAGAAAPEAAAGDPNQKYPFAEAARAAQLAQDLGIQLPKEGALTRQWIDFLNQLAAK